MLCAAGGIEGAGKIGNMWVIPSDAERPEAQQVTTGGVSNPEEKTMPNVPDSMEVQDEG